MADKRPASTRTPELVPSSFSQVLHAQGPDPAFADKLKLYAWLVGTWEMDVTTIAEDATTHQGQGEIHAGWVLRGRASSPAAIRRRSGSHCGSALSSSPTTRPSRSARMS